MAKIKDILEKAERALENAQNSDLPGCRQSYSLLGIGFSLMAIAMIVEDIETGDEEPIGQ